MPMPMHVGSTLPVEIRPLETDVVLEYCSTLCIRAFAQRLPDHEFKLSGALEAYGYEPTRASGGDGVSQADEYRSNPPSFIISPSYEGVQTLKNELDLPTGPSDVYFSKLWSADGRSDRSRRRSGSTAPVFLHLVEF